MFLGSNIQIPYKNIIVTTNDWQGETPYTFTINDSNINSRCVVQVDLVYLQSTSTDKENEKNSYSSISEVQSYDNGTIVLTCFSSKPETTMKLRYYVVNMVNSATD